jgi:hypothetical protein
MKRQACETELDRQSRESTEWTSQHGGYAWQRSTRLKAGASGSEPAPALRFTLQCFWLFHSPFCDKANRGEWVASTAKCCHLEGLKELII